MAILNNQWANYLNVEFEKPYYQKLRQILIAEYKNYTVYPDQHDLFNALHFTNYPDVKVVILGQDPYHGPGQAHGLSFSVKPGIATPPSLQNIYKELNQDIGCAIPNNGYLKKWADQGVLLLNTALSVRAGEANSHASIGWHVFTSAVISALNDHETPIVFLLWGKHAQDHASLVTNQMHLILKAPHPSPLSAHRGFLGCGHFSKANAFLIANGMAPIDWQILSI